MSVKEKLNPNRTARIAGFLYLLQIPLGVFGILYVPKALMVPGDAAATASNILTNEFLFRLSSVSAILTALVTAVTALFLCKVLEPVHKNYARLMVLCTLVVIPISMLNELNHVAVLLLLKDPQYFTTFTASQLQTMVSVAKVVVGIVVQILAVILAAITGDEKMTDLCDERDKAIERRAIEIGFTVVGAGFVAMALALWQGWGGGLGDQPAAGRTCGLGHIG